MAKGENVMNRHMQTATLLRRTVKVDELGEQIVSYVPALANVEIAISVIQGSYNTQNNVLTTSSTHLGLTKDNRTSIGDKIMCEGHAYTVNYIIAGRFNQLFLSEEQAL